MNKRTIVLFFVIYCIWFLFHLDFRISSVILGLGVSGLVTLLSRDVVFTKDWESSRLTWRLASFPLRLILDVYLGALHLCPLIITGKGHAHMIEVDLDIPDGYISTLLANSITLTPGTITVDKQGTHFLILAMIRNESDVNPLGNNIKRRFETLWK